MINIIGFKDRAGEFLQQVIFLIGALGRGQYAKSTAFCFIPDLGEASGGKAKRFLPGGRDETAFFAHERFGESCRTVDEFMDIPSFYTEIVAGHRVVSAWERANDPIVFLMQVKPAAAAAEDTGGQNVFHAEPSKVGE